MKIHRRWLDFGGDDVISSIPTKGSRLVAISPIPRYRSTLAYWNRSSFFRTWAQKKTCRPAKALWPAKRRPGAKADFDLTRVTAGSSPLLLQKANTEILTLRVRMTAPHFSPSSEARCRPIDALREFYPSSEARCCSLTTCSAKINPNTNLKLELY